MIPVMLGYPLIVIGCRVVFMLGVCLMNRQDQYTNCQIDVGPIGHGRLGRNARTRQFVTSFWVVDSIPYKGFVESVLAFANFKHADILVMYTLSVCPNFLYASILVQPVIVTMLMWYYSTHPVSRVERGIALTVAVVYIFVVGIVSSTMDYQYLTIMTHHSLLEQSTKLTLLYSKCSQIWVTQSCRHTGAHNRYE
jgi:hypothetical protein